MKKSVQPASKVITGACVLSLCIGVGTSEAFSFLPPRTSVDPRGVRIEIGIDDVADDATVTAKVAENLWTGSTRSSDVRVQVVRQSKSGATVVVTTTAPTSGVFSPVLEIAVGEEITLKSYSVIIPESLIAPTSRPTVTAIDHRSEAIGIPLIPVPKIAAVDGRPKAQPAVAPRAAELDAIELLSSSLSQLQESLAQSEIGRADALQKVALADASIVALHSDVLNLKSAIAATSSQPTTESGNSSLWPRVSFAVTAVLMIGAFCMGLLFRRNKSHRFLTVRALPLRARSGMTRPHALPHNAPTHSAREETLSHPTAVVGDVFAAAARPAVIFLPGPRHTAVAPETAVVTTERNGEPIEHLSTEQLHDLAASQLKKALEIVDAMQSRKCARFNTSYLDSGIRGVQT